MTTRPNSNFKTPSIWLSQNTQAGTWNCRLVVSDGSQHWVRFIGDPRVDDGNILTLIGTVQDVTERHLVEQALQRSNADLVQFAYVASHDLQSPLRGISGFAKFLQEDYAASLDATAENYIQRIQDGCERMRQLIQDLLAFSRIDRESPTTSMVDLNLLVDDVIDDLGTDLGNSRATVTFDDLPTCRVVESQIRRVFENLIGNGIKYTGEREPVVRVAAKRVDTYWEISVSDNGIGIEPKQQKRVFDVFHRTPRARVLQRNRAWAFDLLENH